MDRRFIITLVIVILAIGGIFIFTNHKSSTQTSTATTSGKVSNHVEGNLKSPVKLLVYGDFECSACAAFFPIESQVLQKYQNQISFTFMEFPLTSLHPNAWAAARQPRLPAYKASFLKCITSSTNTRTIG